MLTKGTNDWGWTHIWKKHVTGETPNGTNFSVVTNDLSENNIKNLISETVKNQDSIFKESTSKICLFSNTIKKGHRILVVVGKQDGKIISAYPKPSEELNCN